MIASTPANLDAAASHNCNKAESIVKRRKLSYWALGGGLFIGYMMLRGADWQGSGQLHTLMEVAATLLALMVGAMALVRYGDSTRPSA